MPIRSARHLAVLAGLVGGVLLGSPLPALARRAPDTLVITVAPDGPVAGSGPLAPGDVRTSCFRLDYRHADPGTTLKFWGEVRDGGLAAELRVDMEEIEPGDAAVSCAAALPIRTVYAGDMRTLGRTHGRSGTAVPLGTLPGESGRLGFRLTVTASRTMTTQGATAAAELLWVAQCSDGSTASAGLPVGSGTGAADRPKSSTFRRLFDRLASLARKSAAPAARLSVVGLCTGLLVFLFLTVQNRIDRRDPKLARAPVRPPDDLVFRRRRNGEA